MASSDDEVEIAPRDVSDFEFLCEDEPISFAELPLDWNRSGNPDVELQQIFLRGKTDNGLRKLYKQVVAWKFDLSCNNPEISVLSVEGHQIKLLKPRKAFEVIIRSILITLHFLHLVKWNPQASEKTLWDRLTKTFSTFDTRPSEDDLVDHTSLIHEALKRDETLAKSKLLSTLLDDKPRKRKAFNEDKKPSFIVDDGTEDEDQNSDVDSEGEDEEDDCFDSVCAICDNGGQMLLCDGKCMRSFHATQKHGEDSNCASLGFSKEELKALENIPFFCKNCEKKQHQCFSCGQLGSSDESSAAGAEVFRCVNGACGRFYHPDCVSKLLHPEDRATAEEHGRKIAAGEQFACPVHRCFACKELEVRSNHELQFAICRRCPRAYHRKCLPRKIAFEKDVDEGRAPIQRAWEGLITNRILIYCLKHQIDERILTPVRNHIKFPDSQQVKRKLPIESSKTGLLKDRSFQGNSAERDYAQPSKGLAKVSFNSKKSDVLRRRMEILPLEGSSKKQKVTVNKDSHGNLKKSTAAEAKISLGDRLYAAYGLDTEPVKPSRGERTCTKHEKTENNVPATRVNDMETLNEDARERILSLMKDASSSVTLEEIKRRHKRPSTFSQSLKFFAENVSSGKVEHSVQALRAALEVMEKGGTIEDAKAVCGNDLLVQVMKWKEKLKVYLAPVLHGTRYTSFGRHFTKTDKLKEIVDMLHWYMQDGDMMVDFCCGSNDFSCLMKKKLDEVGKTCSFKNYDILQPKNDFCFERRDWMKVERKELPEGSRLIMGLNPPFGVNAALANKFIDKALQFKPKLLILIVPRETQRLDEKQSRYDLIWEDDQMLGGKAFYLPGSIDVNEKQIEDWNVNAPLLYLWSSPDWTPKHKAIAEQHGHPSQKKCKLEESPHVMQVSNQSTERQNDDESRKLVNNEHSAKQETQDQDSKVTRGQEEGPSSDNRGDNDNGQSNNHSGGNLKDSNGKRKKKRKRGLDTKVMEEKSFSKRFVALHSSLDVAHVRSRDPNKQMGRHAHVHAGMDSTVSGHHPSPNMVDGSNALVVYSSPQPEIQSHIHAERTDDYQRFDHRSFPSYHSYSQAGDDDNQVDDLVRKYSLNGEETFPSMSSIFTPTTHPDYSRASTEQYIGYPEERTNILPYRSYAGDLGHNYGRDPTLQPPVNIFGREGPNSFNQRSEYVSYSGSVYPSSFRPPNPAANSAYGVMGTSSMQRYASRLDDSNHGQLPPAVPGGSVPDTIGSYHPHGPRPGSVGSLGFAPGPYRPYFHNSSGWLNE